MTKPVGWLKVKGGWNEQYTKTEYGGVFAY